MTTTSVTHAPDSSRPKRENYKRVSERERERERERENFSILKGVEVGDKTEQLYLLRSPFITL